MVRSFADWGSERYLPKVIKSGIGPPVHILIFDFLRPSIARTPVLSSDPEAEWTTGHVAVPTVIPSLAYPTLLTSTSMSDPAGGMGGSLGVFSPPVCFLLQLGLGRIVYRFDHPGGREARSFCFLIENYLTVQELATGFFSPSKFKLFLFIETPQIVMYLSILSLGKIV